MEIKTTNQPTLTDRQSPVTRLYVIPQPKASYIHNIPGIPEPHAVLIPNPRKPCKK